MVGDPFGDIRLRIEESKDLMREVMEAVQLSKSLVVEARAWLDEYRAAPSLRDSDWDGEDARSVIQAIEPLPDFSSWHSL